MKALGIKQAELAAVMKKLADLDSDLAEKVARKESLEAEVEMCKIKLDRWGAWRRQRLLKPKPFLMPKPFHSLCDTCRWNTQGGNVKQGPAAASASSPNLH